MKTCFCGIAWIVFVGCFGETVEPVAGIGVLEGTVREADGAPAPARVRVNVLFWGGETCGAPGATVDFALTDENGAFTTLVRSWGTGPHCVRASVGSASAEGKIDLTPGVPRDTLRLHIELKDSTAAGS